ncbi:BON domain-containing protein [Paraburkholderia sp. DHOC27]|uniref:BON domain-containing protein n=1 Tax=Paraburkholderia sp. DHOC27 TaxID=2303330 RepID=UPI000E3D0BD4|nr:BON domain-containing protein [Paraburkholderia sp. DHOC27]RFU47593.1 BON domain-containing protein [Paraburkholderia sp. DHOC27]
MDSRWNRPFRTLAQSALIACTIAATFPVSAQTTSGPKADRALAHSVRKSLERAHIAVDDVRIRAKDGVVSLDGTVDDQNELSRVPSVAQKVPGVTSLKNDLTLQQEGN